MAATGAYRIVLSTFGSFGDLHPYIAVAQALIARGHRPAIATFEVYRAKVESLGIGFHGVRPEAPPLDDLTGVLSRIMDQNSGPEYVIRQMFMPHLRDSYADMTSAAEDADLLVGHPLMFTTPLVAEKRGLPWASSLLAPLSMFSAHDPAVPPNLPTLEKLRFLGPTFHRMLFRLVRWKLGPWSQPWHQFRSELGLPPAANPILEGQHSPHLVLALFSEVLGRPQPDWPAHTCLTGFPFFDQDGSDDLAPELERFLAAGEPPLVFTLGTSAVLTPGSFFAESVQAAKLLGRRAVLMVGREPQNVPTELPPGVAAFDYAPFSQLFPRAAAIIHQGGVGTTGQALRSGRPMLVVPFAHDQPDNAARVRRRGVARVVARQKYRRDRVARELRSLLDDPSYAKRAAAVGKQVQAEDGPGRAADALLALLTRGHKAIAT